MSKNTGLFLCYYLFKIRNEAKRKEGKKALLSMLHDLVACRSTFHNNLKHLFPVWLHISLSHHCGNIWPIRLYNVASVHWGFQAFYYSQPSWGLATAFQLGWSFDSNSLSCWPNLKQDITFGQLNAQVLWHWVDIEFCAVCWTTNGNNCFSNTSNYVFPSWYCVNTHLNVTDQQTTKMKSKKK